MAGWDTSCLDWEERIRLGRSLVPTLPLFRNEADRAVRVFNRLRLPDVIGTPTFKEAMGDWLRDVVAALFGAFDPASGRRLIQEVFLLVPKKNSKSTGAAGIMLTAAIVNRRPRAELLFVAPTKEIADIAFRQVQGMIGIDPELRKLFHIQRHIRTITHRNTEAVMQIKAADTDTITGGKQTYTLVDETHVFASHSRAKDVFLEIRGARAARPDGFLCQITTQSKAPPSGVFKAELQKARDVRDGKRILPLLPILYELPASIAEDDGWQDPETFRLVNPNLGRSVDQEFLLTEFQNAKDLGREDLILFASQHLNVEIGMALRSDRWTGADLWAAAAIADLTLDALIERSDVVVVGVDGGGLDDLLGLAVLGRERGTRRWLLWAKAWAHEIILERRKEIAPKLRDLEAEGTLVIVPDDSSEDIEQVVEIIVSLDEAGLLPEKYAVGVDPSGISDIVDALELAEFNTDSEAARVTGIRQGSLTLNSSIKTTERRLGARTLVHSGSQLMTWVVGNARVVVKGNAISIEKQAAGVGKIDPLMAAFNAIALMVRNPDASSAGSVFDDLAEKRSVAGETSKGSQADDIDYQALNDPSHPKFAEMARRFNERQAAADHIEDDDEEWQQGWRG